MATDVDLDKLLDAAADEISHYGISRTSVSDIARRAGVSRPTAYRRLGNKDALLQLLLARIAATFWSASRAAVGEAMGVPERAGALFAAGMQTARTHPVVSRLLEDDPETVLRVWTTSDNPQLLAVREQVARSLDPEQTLSREQSTRAADILQRIGVSFLTTPSDIFDETTTRSVVVAAVDAAISATR